MKSCMSIAVFAVCSEAVLEDAMGRLTAKEPGLRTLSNRYLRCCCLNTALELATWKAEDS